MIVVDKILGHFYKHSTFKDDSKSRRNRNITRGVVYTGMVALLAAGATYLNNLNDERKRLDDQKWNHASLYTTGVIADETLSDYLTFENETDINRYVSLVRQLNPGKVGDGPDAKLREGDVLILPDINRDGHVGSKFVKLTVRPGFTLEGYCRGMSAVSDVNVGDCIYQTIEANRRNNDALGRPLVERTDLVRAEYSNGVPAKIKVPRVQIKK